MKLGIYGGTFAPPHKAHIMIAKAFIEQFSLDKLFVVPASIPPHKIISDYDNPTDRYNMARLAFLPLGEKICVSDVELKREGLSYTSDTLKYFKKAYPECDLYLLCGEDMFITLSHWHEPEVIFSLSNIVYALRAEGTEQRACEIKQIKKRYEDEFNAKINLLSVKPLEVSSTDIRECIKMKKPIEKYISSDVAIYIEEHGLYK